MIKNIELEKGAYQFDAKMPLRQAIPLGLQHVFAMFVGNLTPLLIITSACGLAGGEFADLQVSLLQNAMFVAGVVTLVQLFSIGCGRSGPHYHGHQLRLPGRVQQCGCFHGRRCAGLRCHHGRFHSGRPV